ncbi:MAG: hypothetical protein UT23_C0038G0001 [Candidatus Woesebacteria bacterium GW2011_GWA1_39_12]|uniref:DUF192 domain-containing protein n=1 Tax=Candidatus Woesebacteria bacterium GW2011_GWA1_39_12 TaxID=1618549 RepID=A0A0G0PDF8_9BACT|nr:MAG: hypothetical protein UT23_C0038G0001 [Candidatus Woesebacteria bacterium GW2011_GWA1_39_12]
MKQVLLPLAGVAIFLLVTGLIVQRISQTSKNNQGKELAIGNVKIQIEVARTPEEKNQGLSGRQSLAEGSGMLFIFEENSRPNFWMKDMRFAIDIIWINDGKVVQIDRAIPPPELGTKDGDLELYRSNQPIDLVLEVPSGFSDKNQIEVGGVVHWQGEVIK